jgi:hypothetical protein
MGRLSRATSMGMPRLPGRSRESVPIVRVVCHLVSGSGLVEQAKNTVNSALGLSNKS